MNSKLGTAISTALMLAGVALWSATVLADDAVQPATAAQPAQQTRELAADAHQEALDAALTNMREATRLHLDIALVGRTATKIAGSQARLR